jgi:hypothetical protein
MATTSIEIQDNEKKTERITFITTKTQKERMDKFDWVNWSQLIRSNIDGELDRLESYLE